MICRDCRNPHTGEPEGCPQVGCPCQHRGEMPLPPATVEGNIVAWTCKGCDTVVQELLSECDCSDAPITVKMPIFENESE